MTVPLFSKETSTNQPHRNKLIAALQNKNTPLSDKEKLKEALKRYESWCSELESLISSGDELLSSMVQLLNEYKYFIEVELIFDSESDFLYRQKGQLKIDNTILEEFLPRLIDPRLVKGLNRFNDVTTGPQTSYAGMSFTFTTLPINKGGIEFKTKDQDFTAGRRYYIKLSSSENFLTSDTLLTSINVAYFAAEIKTNLDKTMFQEASGTAKELKQTVTGARYILICEWLDMTPISTRITEIDEVIILRRARRLNSNIRDGFSTSIGRRAARDVYVKYLLDNPLSLESFKRIVSHLSDVFPESDILDESDVLKKGYF